MPNENNVRSYRHIFEAISDGLILSDIDTGRVIAANPAACELHGFAEEDFIDLPLAAFMNPDSYAQYAGSAGAVRAGYVFAATVVHMRRDGTPFNVEVRGTGCMHKEQLCLLSVVRDVSARVQGEQVLREQVDARTREQATQQERQRLAQNLHDAVNQSLFSASLIAEVLPRLWERDQDEARQSLEDLRRLTRGAMAEMRGLLAELRPLVLTDAELGDLLRQLGDALTGRTNIPVAVTVTGEGALPAEVQVAYYRLCQEALTNVAKHAGAGRVEIDLRHQPGAVALHIRDDGCGFNPAHISSGHHGLSIMHERAQAIGADLSVSSRPGHGTEIVVRWPVAAEKVPE